MATPPIFNSQQGKYRTWPAPVPGSTNNLSVGGAANQAATVVLAGATTAGTGPGLGQGAVTNPAVIVRELWWSYSGTPTGGRVTLNDGTGNVFDWDITAGGPGFKRWDPPQALAAGTQLTATIAAGGGGVTGKIGLDAWQEF